MIPSPTVTTVALAVGHVIGGSAAVPLVFQATSTWYRKISLPAWTPPDRVFGPVWTVLYASMGIAVARVLQRLPAGVAAVWKTPAVGLWILHYAVNLCWAPAFFGAKRLRLGLWINYVLLGTLVGGVIPMFASSNLTSALLLVPYCLWLAYATALNQAICKLNPTDSDGYNDAKFHDGLIRLQQKAAKYAGVKT
jgi:translocator protein